MNILANIDNPGQLEKLYRENKRTFKSEFHSLYPSLTGNKLADFWNERLKYEGSEISWGSNKELTFVIIASLIAGIIAQFPKLFNFNPDFFYPRNIGFIIFPVLTAYFIWKRNLAIRQIIFIAVGFLIPLIFINLLPAANKSDTLILSCIHLPLLLWSVLGITYVGDYSGNYSTRIEYLRYNGS